MRTVNRIGGRFSVLTPFLRSETNLVLHWRNNDVYIKNCTNRKYLVTEEEFTKELKYDFLNDRQEQYIIKKQSNNQPIGTIYSYNYKKEDGFVFITIFLLDNFCRRVFGAEAIALFILYLTQIHNIKKVYCDVYKHNSFAIKSLLKGGFCEVGNINTKHSDGLYRYCLKIDKIYMNQKFYRLVSNHFNVTYDD